MALNRLCAALTGAQDAAWRGLRRLWDVLDLELRRHRGARHAAEVRPAAYTPHPPLVTSHGHHAPPCVAQGTGGAGAEGRTFG